MNLCGNKLRAGVHTAALLSLASTQPTATDCSHCSNEYLIMSGRFCSECILKANRIEVERIGDIFLCNSVQKERLAPKDGNKEESIWTSFQSRLLQNRGVLIKRSVKKDHFSFSNMLSKDNFAKYSKNRLQVYLFSSKQKLLQVLKYQDTYCSQYDILKRK